MNVQEILNKLQRNESLSAEETDYMYKAMKAYGSGKVPASEKSNFNSYDDFQSRLTNGLQNIYNSPAARSFADSLIRQKRSDIFMRRFQPLFNAISNGADVGIALS